MVAVKGISDVLVDFIRNTFKNQKEMFLHLLLCNSAYALDRLQFEWKNVPPPLGFINLIPYKTNNALTIINNGVGMTKADLVNLASAATFRQAIASGADLNIISQFGFAFYFASLVADKVVVTTKHYSDEQYIWEFQAGGASTLTRDTSDDDLECGSSITLFLKEDQLEYLDYKRLQDLVLKYSYNISYETYLTVTETYEHEVPFGQGDQGKLDKMEKEEKKKTTRKFTVTDVSLRQILPQNSVTS